MAALYELGADGRGQRGVIHAVLDWIRAPGFPKAVRYAVYQGYTV